MSGFTAIELDQLPPAAVVEALDFETILAAAKADLAARAPELAEVLALESEPLVKALQTFSYLETLLRGRVNDAARAVMLASAAGADLDQIAARFGVARLVVQAADPTASPPIPEILEADAPFRRRVQLSLEGYTSAGSVGAYTFHALSASPEVKDVSITSPVPGLVRVSVLSTVGNGAAAGPLLDAVNAALSADEVRPLCDTVSVQSAAIIPYTVAATLITYGGPDPAVVVASADAAVRAYVAEHHALGHDVTLSGLYAALHRPGVQRVELAAPAAGITVDAVSAAFCTAVAVTHGGIAL